MNRLRAILVDDERLAIKQMRKLLDEQPGISVIGTAGGLTEAVTLLAQESPDVVFLDISMPPASGFDLLPHLSVWTRVVFVTAYSEHAIHAFEARALDYLLKPVDPERLAQAIERVREIVMWQRGASLKTGAGAGIGIGAGTEIGAVTGTGTGIGEKMSLGDNRYWERIPIEEIAAVASEGNYSCVHTLDGSNFFIRRTMQEWRTRLTPAGFVGLSRSLLIQPAAILRLEVISRNETMIHLYGVPAPFRLGRTASLRARRYQLG